MKRAAANVMTVVYYAQGVDVTILASQKSGVGLFTTPSSSLGGYSYVCLCCRPAGRYRMQSGSFEALALVTEVSSLNHPTPSAGLLAQ